MTDEDLVGRTAMQWYYPKRATFEHIVPLSAGGYNGAGNLCMVHSACNQSRGIHDFDIYRENYGWSLYEWCKAGFDLCHRPSLPDPKIPFGVRVPSISVRVVA